jgi:hypothetical protein
MGQSEVEDYILSKYDIKNDLVYFFIIKANAYAFIITDHMEESERMQSLVNYTMTRDIVGFQSTSASEMWYNDYSTDSFLVFLFPTSFWFFSGFLPSSYAFLRAFHPILPFFRVFGCSPPPPCGKGYGGAGLGTLPLWRNLAQEVLLRCLLPVFAYTL